MAGAGWRLLVAFFVILITALLRAQDDARRLAVPAPSRDRPLFIIDDRGDHPPSPRPPPRYPVSSGSLAFEQMVRSAGIIFSGHVTSVGGPARLSGNEAGATAITFHVDLGLRGPSTGQNVTIREWAGLWRSGERYQVGQRVMLFLYSPSQLGLTSPDAGFLGRFAMDAGGRIVLNPQQVAALASDPKFVGKTDATATDLAQAVQRAAGAR